MPSLIRSRVEKSLWAWCVALCVAWGQPVRAAEEAAAPAQAQARAKAAEGSRAYDMGEFQKALEAYGEAYHLVPRPGLLFNMAQCHRQLGQPDRAAFLFRRYLYLTEGEVGAGAPDAALVKELLEEAEVAVQREQKRQRLREETARERARAAALKAEAEAAAARQVQESSPLSAAPLPPSTAASTSHRGLPWVGVGATAAVLVGGIVYALATSRQPPTPSLGTLR